MLRSLILFKNGKITGLRRLAWALRQGGLRDLEENGMRVLGGHGADPFRSVLSLYLLDPETGPESKWSAGHLLFSGWRRAPEQVKGLAQGHA